MNLRPMPETKDRFAVRALRCMVARPIVVAMAAVPSQVVSQDRGVIVWILDLGLQ